MEAPPPLDDPLVRGLAAGIPADLCDACLGRAFARLEPGQENAQRGRRLRGGHDRPDAQAPCGLCEGIVDRIGRYEEWAASAAEGFEFTTFLVGSKYFDQVVERERRLWTDLMTRDAHRLAARLPPPGPGAPPWPAGEWLKNEVNRTVGRRLESRWPHRRADLADPEAVLTIDTRVDLVVVETRPVHIAGRYRKLVRDLPQTRWPCRSCRGAGCRACAYVGKRYPSSVEEEVAGPAMAALEAEDAAFHGMGREDIDARMLGSGRPFVLELKRPRRRSTDLVRLAEAIHRAAAGRVEVEALAWVDGAAVAAFKAADPPKAYRAQCRASEPVDRDKLIRASQSLEGALLDQRTPRRVSHRRADLVRRRRVREIRLLDHVGDRFDLAIEADAGTYIKEFVSGDDGRTSPSLSERLGIPVRVEALDVIAIHWEEPNHGRTFQRPEKQVPPDSPETSAGTRDAARHAHPGRVP